MHRLVLERAQVGVYLCALAAGLALGTARPGLAPLLQALLWPALALLLYVTFVQVPLAALRAALRDRRFAAAMLLGNFLLLPLLAWALVSAFALPPPLRLGVLLVLLVPCTDWFLSFCQLGRGDMAHAMAITPLNLLAQLLLLPLWLLLIGGAGPGAAAAAPVPVAAALLLLGPLALAALSEAWIAARPARAAWRERLAWTPVPLLALVLLLVAAAQAPALRAAGAWLGRLVPLYLLFLAGAALLAWALARALRLPQAQGRTLAFGLGTRNSFVVLPLALALPPGWELAAMAIVLQSLVELLAMALWVWWVPSRLFPER